VPEYDAFGREIGQNTLAGLGGDSSADSRPAAAPDREAQAAALRAAAASEAPAPEPPAISIGDPAPQAVPPPPQFIARRRAPRAIGCLFSLVFLAAVVGVIGIAAAGIFGAAKDAIDDVTDTIDSPALPVPDAPAEPPSGIAGDSLISPANLERVLAELGGRYAAQLVVRPDRVAGDLLQGGRGRLVQISADGSVSRSDPHPAAPDPRRVDLRDLDVRAPARLVRRSAAHFKVRPEGIDYLIASPDFTDRGAHHWVAYFKNGVYVEGDASGKVRRRID
jgi:hypothetical protein